VSGHFKANLGGSIENAQCERRLLTRCPGIHRKESVRPGGAIMPFVELLAGDSAHRPTNRIMTFREWCARNSFSPVTAWRIMKAGDGPKVSARRIGIREDHHSEWLETRKVRLPRRAKSRSK
jgi:predicted DNA-binding transcriptional regulator AlpA